ncbi:MAG: hypothetical protein NZ929_07340 [Aigarchaeota archaeon]|nr:hypothetical protein [Aigarchaeota archaeon]MCX8193161.1 hypothetical protein [Nitrososphaeria archaeon]MDW7986302.1 hypothetical protein [Nitrososphaerota archaeon]
MSSYSVPPEAETIKSLLNISAIIALIFGILYIIIGAITLIFLMGIVFIIFGVVDIIIYLNIKSISELVDERRYQEAKNKTLTWMVIGFILGGIIIGILLLIAYLKYDELIRSAGLPPPPPPPPV